jgi:hypothetical protein
MPPKIASSRPSCEPAAFTSIGRVTTALSERRTARPPVGRVTPEPGTDQQAWGQRTAAWNTAAEELESQRKALTDRAAAITAADRDLSQRESAVAAAQQEIASDRAALSPR